MKKIFVIVISLNLIFLLGCSNERDKTNLEKNIDNTISTEEETNYEYEELSKVSEKIDMQNYNMNVETDNVGKRIIIFEKDGKKIYKSIFVKSNRLLKLIDLENGEKLLINKNI